MGLNPVAAAAAAGSVAAVSAASTAEPLVTAGWQASSLTTHGAKPCKHSSTSSSSQMQNL
jgi:hypothetical protein